MGNASLSAAALAFLAGMSGAALAQTTSFLQQEGAETWRISKLPGVAVFGPDNKKVGDVTDVLIDHDGKAAAIVIGVGGFLGLGQKDVAVSFDQVKFTDQPLPQPASSSAAPGPGPTVTALGMPADTTGNPSAPMATGMAPASNNAQGAGSINTANTTPAPTMQEAPGMAAPTSSVANAPAVAPGMPNGSNAAVGSVRSTSYPDHGNIALTADQLKTAPAFQFAR